MKRTISLIIMVIILIPLTFLSCKKKEEVIKIGAVMPLTGEGAVYGVPQKRAAEIAVNEINEAGGLLDRKVLLIAQDDKALPTEAVNVAHLFVNTKDIVGIIGHPNSGNAIAASKIYKENNLPYIVTSATNPVITQQGFRNVFRFAPTDDMQGNSAAEFIFNRLKVKELVIIHDNAAYGQGIASQVKKRFESLGGTIFLFDALIPGENDYRSILIKASSFKPGVIFYGGMHPEAAILLKQSKELGLEVKFVFGDGCFEEKLIDLAGVSGKNVYISFLAPPWDKVQSAKNFVTKYKALYKTIPPFAPYGYDAVLVLAEAIKIAKSTNHDEIINVLHDPKFVIQGVTGEIRFNEYGQTIDRSFYFYTFNEKGKLILYGG